MKFAVKGDFIFFQTAADRRKREVAIIKDLPFSVYDKETKLWKVPLSIEVIERLEKSFPKLPPSITGIKAALLERERIIQHQRTEDVAGYGYEFPVQSGIELYDHQKRGAAMALTAFGAFGGYHPEHSGFGLLFEMGCGKTLTAIAVMGVMYRLKKIKRVLIVAPSSVVPVWGSELDRYADFPHTVTPIQGTSSKRCKALKELADEEGLQAAVINYEGVWRAAQSNSVFDGIKEFDADLIVCDESQRIKNPAAKVSKAMHILGDMARYKLILSGTPMSNSPMDFWSQYRFMDSTVFGPNYYRYRDTYAVLGGFGGKKVVGIRDTEDLMRKVHSMALRVSKADALDLPEQVFIDRPCILTAAERKYYDELKNRCCAELDGMGRRVTAEVVVVKLLRLQQLTGGFAQADGEDEPRPIGSAKLKVLEDIFEDVVLGSSKKIVVFARFRAELAAIETLARRMGIGFVGIDGSVSLEKRGEAVKEFQESPDCMIFVAQIDTAGLGITLTAADTAVYYSTNFSYAAYEQSLSRIHRIGQVNKCTYIRLIAPDTVDERVYEALNNKKNFADFLVDGWRGLFE